MLNHHHCVAFIHQAVQHVHQYANVFEVKAGGGFVENVERFSRVAFRKLCSQFHALALAAGKRGGGLSQLDVAQSHLLNGFNFLQDVGHRFKELHRLVDGHVEHIGNRLSLVAHLQCFAVIALTMTSLAGYHHIGQKVHFNGFVAVAAASFASPALHVEREPARFVAANLGFGQVHEEVANVREYPRVGCRIAARCSPERTLVNAHHLIYIFHPFHGVVGHGALQRAIEVLAQNRLQRFVHQCGLARSAYPRNQDELAQWKFHAHVFQVVARGAFYANAFSVAFAPLGRHFNAAASKEIFRRKAVAVFHFGR